MAIGLLIMATVRLPPLAPERRGQIARESNSRHSGPTVAQPNAGRNDRSPFSSDSSPVPSRPRAAVVVLGAAISAPAKVDGFVTTACRSRLHLTRGYARGQPVPGARPLVEWIGPRYPC